ncbi:unnamed protein product [Mytilus coruscus]|uniref:WSC domain-containing protein n=1 Tax=Mytilus coruscus TaxID=42192 RepID=A0A6J8E0L1_MYTCO|nr:unnamed protein product [Mytilus coruscus]
MSANIVFAISLEYTEQHYVCVAAQIKQNGVVEKILRRCRDKLPGLCTGIRKALSKASSVTSSTMSQNRKHFIRRISTSPSLQSSTLPRLTISALFHLPKSTIVSIVETTTSLAVKETTLLGKQETIFPRYQKTASQGFRETNSPGFNETTYQEFQENTSPALLESFSSSVPGSDEIDAILIIAIIAAVILAIIIIIVTAVFCKRKRTTQFTVSDQPMANVGKEVVYAQVNKPTVKSEKCTSSQKSQPAASDDTYDLMEHCRLSQTHNPTESNYDTMRSIANAGEEENNYDHFWEFESTSIKSSKRLNILQKYKDVTEKHISDKDSSWLMSAAEPQEELEALYVFHIIIVLLWIVPHNRGGQLRAVLTNSSHEWFKVPDSCRLLTNERNIAHSPSVLTGLGWTKMSAKYLPWVEYLGCVRFRERKQLKATKTQVRKGEQLKECILYCTGYQFFGLQNLVCFCLLNFTLNDTFIESRCEINNVDRCFGDPFAFCGRESPGSFISVYQKVSIDAKHGFIGNCLAVNTRYQNDFKGWNCSTKFYQICRNSYSNTFTIGSRNKSNWKEAFNNCHPNSLASHISFKTNSNIGGYETFWLSNTRRWVTQKRDEGKLPEFCVAARIKQNGDVERILHKCSSPLPGLCIEIQNVPSNDLSKTSSPLPSATSFSSRLDKTSPPLPNTTFQGQTISTYSASLQSTYLSQLASTSSALKESIGTSTVVQATTFVGFPEYTSPDLLEFPPSDVPAKDELGVISAIVIIAIAAAFLIVIVILVTIILCKR